MAYIVKWTDATGRIHASEPQESPGDALRFSRSRRLAQARDIWAENATGHRFPIVPRHGESTAAVRSSAAVTRP